MSRGPKSNSRGGALTHAHKGIINRLDFDQMVELVVAMLQKLDGPTVAGIRDFTP